jgi:hypothetical protein
VRIFALLLSVGCLTTALACASKPPPPPMIETEEAKLDPARGGPAGSPSATAAASSKPDDFSLGSMFGTGGGTKAAPSKSAGDDAPPAASPGPPEVKLLAPGKAPLEQLRHSFRSGGKQKLEMKSKTRVTGASLPIPPISLNIPMESQIVEVNKAGEARFKFSAGPFQTGMGGGGGALGGLGALFGGGGGGGTPQKIAGWGWITQRGVIREYHVEEGAQNGDAPVETGDPFPEEAVGVGARWQVKQVLDEKDGPVEQTTVYELLSFEKKKKLVTTRFERVQVPTGGSNAGAGEKSNGELVFHLGEVYPTGKLSMTRAMALDIPGMQGGLKLASQVVISRR